MATINVALPIMSFVDGGFCIVYVLRVLCCELGIRNNSEESKWKMIMEEKINQQEKKREESFHNQGNQ